MANDKPGELQMHEWKLDSFTPSDGQKVGGIPVDHTAWLRGGPVNVALNIASIGVSEEQARNILQRMVDGLNTPAPAAQWREKGEPDPHGTRYVGSRKHLAGGQFSDDQVANAVFMTPSIEWLTIAKDRIRWLSRRLVLLEKALKPFADYADGNRQFPRGGQISQGSSQARKQLTMGNCYDAHDALQGKESADGK